MEGKVKSKGKRKYGKAKTGTENLERQKNAN